MTEGISKPHLYQNSGVVAPCVVLTGGPLVEPDAERTVPLHKPSAALLPEMPGNSTSESAPESTKDGVEWPLDQYPGHQP